MLLLFYFNSIVIGPSLRSSMILRLGHHNEKLPWQTPVGWFYRTPMVLVHHRAHWLMQCLRLWHLVLCLVTKVLLFPLENLSRFFVCLKQMYMFSAFGLPWFPVWTYILLVTNSFGMKCLFVKIKHCWIYICKKNN